MSILETVTKSVIPKEYLLMSTEELETRVRDVKNRLGKRLFIPGHHYQKDEVIQFADARGDSLVLAQLSAENRDAEFIAFCGVHFMAETADILTTENQKVFFAGYACRLFNGRYGRYLSNRTCMGNINGKVRRYNSSAYLCEFNSCD